VKGAYWLRKYQFRKGNKHPHFKSGRNKTGDGYVTILAHWHPFANSNHRILEHRLIMEGYLRRFLKPNEIVHHINGIKDDNRIENLKLITKSIHRSLHNIGNQFAKGNKNWLGRKHTKETKRKIGNAHRGKKISEEQKEKIRKTLAIYRQKRGKIRHSKETIEKMRQSVKRRKRNKTGQFI